MTSKIHIFQHGRIQQTLSLPARALPGLWKKVGESKIYLYHPEKYATNSV